MKLLRSGFLMLSVLPLWLCAQVNIDTSWKSQYLCKVKSLEEFAARFNLEESHPDAGTDSMANYSNIYSLFDFERISGKPDEIQRLDTMFEFCDSILDHNIRFSMENGGVFVGAKCKISYKKKTGIVDIYFKRDKTPKGYDRWSILAVTGLERSGLVDLSRISAIPPTEHEMHFMGLDEVFNLNPSNAFGYRYSNNDLDQTSVFLALVHSGQLHFEEVDNVAVYCADVPGFIFVVEELPRNTRNSGWLITSLIRTDTDEKIQFLNNLLQEK